MWFCWCLYGLLFWHAPDPEVPVSLFARGVAARGFSLMFCWNWSADNLSVSLFQRKRLCPFSSSYMLLFSRRFSFFYALIKSKLYLFKYLCSCLATVHICIIDCCVVFIMAEDMLMLNISSQDSPYSYFSEEKHKKSSSWTAVSYCTYLTTLSHHDNVYRPQ